MKKITKPAAKTPAPASKVEKPAKTVTKKVDAPVKKAAAAPVPAPAPAAKPVKAKAVKAAPVELVPPAPKSPKAPKVVKAAVAPKAEAKVEAKPAATTTIVAAVDVGFGNVLTLRGEGAGLSWDTGLALECAAGDRWTITLPASEASLVVKFLINDSVWSAGENYTVVAGSSVVLSPVF